MSFLHVNRLNDSSTKIKALHDAKIMQKAIAESCAKDGKQAPPYNLTELIGKGSFGRVYKAKSSTKGQVVAIKIIDIEQGDTPNPRLADTFSDLLKEINALQLLSASGAKNINHVIEAIPVGQSMWVVTEYCAGGSVSTLMRPNAPAGLQEKWIIPILREVAEAMRWVHAQGIIHRDLKGANVLVTEEGSVQLCDFGVAGVIESKFDKRTTVIGTPNWMAPELFDETTSYGTEVDIWAFGAMAYEIAFGQPPNVTLGMDFSKLGSHLKHNSPRLEGEHFSTELKDLVAFCLQNDRALRPGIDQVRRHRYIVDTEAQFPTSSLSHLVRAFKLWEAQGGDRRSLFSAGGAQGLDGTVSTDAINDDWNFSTTAAFDEQVFNDGGVQDIYDVYGSDAEIVEDFSENTTLQAKSRPRRRPPKNVPTVKQPLEKLFDPNTLSNYEDNSRLYYRPFQPTPMTDLPLRDDTMPAPDVRESLIDLDESLNGSRLSHFADLDTIRPSGFQAMSEEHDQNDQAAQSSTNPAVDNTNRRTRDWKFPTMVFTPTSPEDSDAHHRSQLQSLSEMPQLELADSNANLSTVDTNDLIRLERTASIASLIDLDMSIMSLHDFDVDRPSTSHSGVESVTSSEVSVVSPFEFEKHASLQGAFGASHIREPSIYVADDEGFADNHLNSAAHNPVLRDNDALSLDNRHGVVTGRPYSLSEFADTDPELLMPTEPQGVSQDAFKLFPTQEIDQQHNENGLQSTKRFITEHTIALPSLAEAPAVDVMQGRATQQDVKCELQRMARSLSEHLSYANQILANLPVGQVALTQKPSKTP